MNFAFRFALAAILLMVGSLPESIAYNISGVRQIEVTHFHSEADHHKDREIEGHDHSDEGSSHSHTHHLILAGIQALVSNTTGMLVYDYPTTEFPFPKNLSMPLSQDLGSIFRPPISA